MGLPGDEPPLPPGQSSAPSSNQLWRPADFQRHGGGISAGVTAGNPKTSGGLPLMKTFVPEMKVVKMTHTGNERQPRGWLTGYETHQKTIQACGFPLCVSVSRV